MVTYDYDDTAYRVQSDSTDQLVSRNHRRVTEHDGTRVFEFAEDAAQKCQICVPTLEGLSNLLRDLPVPQQDASITKQDMLGQVQGAVCFAGETQNNDSGVSGVSRAVHQTPKPFVTGADTDVFTDMFREADEQTPTTTQTHSKSADAAFLGDGGANNHAWKGGVTEHNRKGNHAGARYVKCPSELLSMARRDGYVMEHRLMVAQAIGRPLLRREEVHHRNHKALDNRLPNLMLFATHSDHMSYEHHNTPEPLWQC